MDSDGMKKSVDGGGRDGQKRFGDLGRENSEGLDVAGEPER